MPYRFLSRSLAPVVMSWAMLSGQTQSVQQVVNFQVVESSSLVVVQSSAETSRPRPNGAPQDEYRNARLDLFNAGIPQKITISFMASTEQPLDIQIVDAGKTPGPAYGGLSIGPNQTRSLLDRFIAEKPRPIRMRYRELGPDPRARLMYTLLDS